jgi:hypothetical protein
VADVDEHAANDIVMRATESIRKYRFFTSHYLSNRYAMSNRDDLERLPASLLALRNFLRTGRVQRKRPQ